MLAWSTGACSSEGAGRRLHVSLSVGSRIRLAGLTSTAIESRGHQLVQQLKALGPYLRGIKLMPVRLPPGRLRLATRPSLTGSSPREDDRNCRGRRLGRQCRGVPRRSQSTCQADQIGRQCRQPIVLIFRPAVFDRHVFALDVAGFL